MRRVGGSKVTGQRSNRAVSRFFGCWGGEVDRDNASAQRLADVLSPRGLTPARVATGNQLVDRLSRILRVEMYLLGHDNCVE